MQRGYQSSYDDSQTNEETARHHDKHKGYLSSKINKRQKEGAFAECVPVVKWPRPKGSCNISHKLNRFRPPHSSDSTIQSIFHHLPNFPLFRQFHHIPPYFTIKSFWKNSYIPPLSTVFHHLSPFSQTRFDRLNHNILYNAITEYFPVSLFVQNISHFTYLYWRYYHESISFW